jgi:hypothetical protein
MKTGGEWSWPTPLNDANGWYRLRVPSFELEVYTTKWRQKRGLDTGTRYHHLVNDVITSYNVDSIVPVIRHGGGLYESLTGPWIDPQHGATLQPAWHTYARPGYDPSAGGSYDILFGLASIPDSWASPLAIGSALTIGVGVSILTAYLATPFIASAGLATTTAAGTTLSFTGTVAVESLAGATGMMATGATLRYSSGGEIGKGLLWDATSGAILGGAFGAARYAMFGGSLVRPLLTMTSSAGRVALPRKTFYSYYDGVLDATRGEFTASSGRVYMTTAAPGGWLTEEGLAASVTRFVRTGRWVPYENPSYFTTGLVNPAEFGLAPIFPRIANFWKSFGGQYHTQIGISGFKLAPGQTSIIIPVAIRSTPSQVFQAWGGLTLEATADVAAGALVGTGGYLMLPKNK